MLELATLAVTAVAGLGVAVAVRVLMSRPARPAPARWSEVGGIALLGGLVGGFGAGSLLTGLDGWDWGLALLPGVFLGMFAGILPAANRAGLATVAWGSFTLGVVPGFLLGVILGGL